MNRIAELLKQHGMTQKELCDEIGITPPTLTRWINGLRVPSVENALRLCEVLGESVEGVFSENPATNPKEFAPGNWCSSCKYEDKAEWEMPCKACVFGCKNYWKHK